MPESTVSSALGSSSSTASSTSSTSSEDTEEVDTVSDFVFTGKVHAPAPVDDSSEASMISSDAAGSAVRMPCDHSGGAEAAVSSSSAVSSADAFLRDVMGRRFGPIPVRGSWFFRRLQLTAHIAEVHRCVCPSAPLSARRASVAVAAPHPPPPLPRTLITVLIPFRRPSPSQMTSGSTTLVRLFPVNFVDPFFGVRQAFLAQRMTVPSVTVIRVSSSSGAVSSDGQPRTDSEADSEESAVAQPRALPGTADAAAARQLPSEEARAVSDLMNQMMARVFMARSAMVAEAQAQQQFEQQAAAHELQQRAAAAHAQERARRVEAVEALFTGLLAGLLFVLSGAFACCCCCGPLLRRKQAEIQYRRARGRRKAERHHSSPGASAVPTSFAFSRSTPAPLYASL